MACFKKSTRDTSLLLDIFKLEHLDPNPLHEFTENPFVPTTEAAIIDEINRERIFGKESKQKELIANLQQEFAKIQRQYNLPPGDFPDISRFQDHLKTYDFSKFQKLNSKLIDSMDYVLSYDLPELMQIFPHYQKRMTESDPNCWVITDEMLAEYTQVFQTLMPIDGKLSGAQAKKYMVESGLSNELLKQVW